MTGQARPGAWLTPGDKLDDYSPMRSDSPLQKRTGRAPSISGLWAEHGLLRVVRRQTSVDGTRKLLLGLDDGQTIETVIMPMPRTHTLCLSSQVGCPVGCSFCRTGLSGFTRNLSLEELMAQVRTAGQELLTAAGVHPLRAVFMGMGEPLLNFDSLCRCLTQLTRDRGPHLSWRKIQVSTVGIPDRLEELGRLRLALPAISLHAPTQAMRDRIMPGARRWPLHELMRVLRAYPLPDRERITAEYILIRDVNDADDHARRLADLLGGIRAKVNLIPCNPVPGSPHRSPAPQRIADFARTLRGRGVAAFVRRSLGPDIAAACGQLKGGPPAADTPPGGPPP